MEAAGVGGEGKGEMGELTGGGLRRAGRVRGEWLGCLGRGVGERCTGM